MRRSLLAICSLVLLVVLSTSNGAHPSVVHAVPSSADWVFQVGTFPVQWPEPLAAWDLLTQLYYCPTGCTTYPDSSYHAAVWS
ncbi:MAG TPA: hypothetical protein VK821_05995, partial [Dehalococcoidia bacterium]|nr:hypothetical protein [Dehalococcoidia bacterium]